MEWGGKTLLVANGVHARLDKGDAAQAQVLSLWGRWHSTRRLVGVGWYSGLGSTILYVHMADVLEDPFPLEVQTVCM